MQEVKQKMMKAWLSMEEEKVVHKVRIQKTFPRTNR